jgi:SepF-like predicted cell division protein (DUF552 family)
VGLVTGLVVSVCDVEVVVTPTGVAVGLEDVPSDEAEEVVFVLSCTGGST